MHLYKSLGILLKDNNNYKLKNATDVFLHKKYNSVSWRTSPLRRELSFLLRINDLDGLSSSINSVSSFSRGAFKVILNDSPLNFGC